MFDFALWRFELRFRFKRRLCLSLTPYRDVGGHCSHLQHKDDLGPAALLPTSALLQMDIFHVFVVLTFCFGVADQKKFSSSVYIVWLHQDKV